MKRTEKIKKHFHDNKKVYQACGVTAVIAVLGTLVAVNRKPELVVAGAYNKQVGVVNKNTVDVYVEALGDPGNIIQDTTTGIVYASQGQAARELGLDPRAISKHMNGRSPHVDGHSFEKLGKAQVAV